MKIEVDEGHKIGVRVPVGGSNCAKCSYVSSDELRCSNSYFKKWNGGAVLPAPADRYCCDFFETKTKDRMKLSDQLRHQRARK